MPVLSLPRLQLQKACQNLGLADKVLDCRRVAAAVHALAKETKERFQLQPSVAILLPLDGRGDARPDSSTYVNRKLKAFKDLGIPAQVHPIPPTLDQKALQELVSSLGSAGGVTGLMAQLPFPPSSPIEPAAVLDMIPLSHDIDGLSMGAKAHLLAGEPGNGECRPATPLGICALLDFYRIETQGKHVVILGKGRLVGEPLAVMLAAPPYNATVTSCDVHTERAEALASSADILVVAIGSPHRIKAEYLKPGGIVIDVGINRAGKGITGDVCPSAYETCGRFTPVPGGVGLLTVSALAFNTVNCALGQAGFPRESLSRILRREYSTGGSQLRSRAPAYTDTRPLRILLISSAYNGMTQRVERELSRAGHAVEFQVGDSADSMRRAVADFQPDLVICPTLMSPIPADVTRKVKCLIVHPGIRGDRGPSAIDWAILEEKPEWGVTILEAAEEMDAGDIWASGTYALPVDATKTGVYNSATVDTAAKLVLECVERFQDPEFEPEPLDYAAPATKGRLHVSLKQSHAERNLNFETDSSAAILRKIRAGDSQPGTKARFQINGESLTRFLYGGHSESLLNADLTAAPGTVIAQRDEAVCIATLDGAVWAAQLRSLKTGSEKPLKLPATIELGPERVQAIPRAFQESLLSPPSAETFQEIGYEQFGPVGLLHFQFYNGAMSTAQCVRLKDAISQLKHRPHLQALILAGSPGTFSNGIHLSVIEAAPDPAAEAFANIRAINGVVKEILGLTGLLTISALQGNAGAGGVYLGLGTDFTFGRPGTVLNPHYRKMGLFGSELHTYTGPRRVGEQGLTQLTMGARPILSQDAVEIRLFDDLRNYLGGNGSFMDQVKTFAGDYVVNSDELRRRLDTKMETYCREAQLRLACEERELEEMYLDMYGNRNQFAERRKAFLRKRPYSEKEGNMEDSRLQQFG